MRTLRKFTCFVLAVAMMISGMTFASAASQEAKNLNKLGLLLNITDEELSQKLDRVIGITMVLKSLGYKDEDVKNKAADNPFVDMDKHSWAKGFAAVAYENKITTGINTDAQNRQFGPANPLSKKELLTFMLRVLGYDSAEAWANTESLADKAGILTDNSELDYNFTKDDAARIMYRAMNAKLVGKEGRLIDRLVEKGKVKKENAIAVGLMEPEKPKTLEVESVEASNLRQIKVTFNREINADSAKRLSNYKLSGTKGVSSRTLSEVMVQEGNKEVLLTVGASLSSSSNPSVLEVRRDYVLTIKDVKDTTGQVLTKTERTFTAEDGNNPEILSIEFTGPRNAKLIFSEPIKTVGTVKIYQNNSNFSVKRPEIDAALANVVKVETYSNFKPGVNYRFEVSEMKDFANYPNRIHVEDKTYAKEEGSPTATIVAADQGKVEVVFDRPVKGLTNKHFYHTFAHQTAKEIYKDAALKQKISSSEYVSKVWVVFATGLSSGDYPLPPTAELNIIGKINALQIQDSWGNKFGDFRQILNVVSDNSTPAIDNIDVQSETKIVITYTKDLSSAGSYKIISSTNSGRTLANPSTSLSGKTVTLTFSKISEKTAILEIRGVKDNTLTRNEMPLERRDIEFTDKTFEGVISADFKTRTESGKIVGGEIFVQYNEEVSGNALEGKNYEVKLAGNIEKLDGQTLDFGESNKSVVISLSEILAKKISDNLGTAKFIMGSGVTDVAGNVYSTFQKEIALTGVSAATWLRGNLIKDGDTNKVEFHFNRGIRNILKDNGVRVQNTPALVFENGELISSSEFKITGINVKNDDSRVVEITLSHNIYTTDGLFFNVEEGTFEDVHEVKVPGFTTNPLEDKVAPTFATKDGKRKARALKQGANYYVAIEYTEAISENSLASGTYEISGTDDFVSEGRPTVNGREVWIQVIPKANADFTTNFYIIQKQAIQDGAGNRLNGDNESVEIVRESSWQ